jgi:hypothetical protein
MRKPKSIVLIAVLCLGALAAAFLLTRHRSSISADSLLLFVPDGASFSDPKVAMWVDAGNEEGLHVVPMHDSEFLRPFRRSNFAGVILPDSIHREASDLLVTAIRRFVADGGKLMLVYDAGTLTLNGRYAAGPSRFSELAGVSYGMYDTLHDETTKWSKISGARKVLDQLGVPPGKYFPFRSQTTTSGKKAVAQPAEEGQLRRYMYGDLEYPSFVTSGDYSGDVLLHSEAGVVAGERSYEKGSVLFVNLPLGYLKGNTDGLPLHAFLKYFAGHLLSLPYLLTVPDGVGGLTLNWHVDSNAGIKPLQQLDSWSLLQQGPYSVHITAGPDAMELGDKRGFNVEHNPVSQALIREYDRRGYSIGSHGGWIHNYFAAHVGTDNPKDLEKYLAWNKTALEQVTGKAVIEYSAPDGNQPQWVTEWLEAHGFVAYYFTGDTGMGPTQGYRDGKREGQNIWAFPILHLDRAAGFEEFDKQQYPNSEVEQWLEAITQFTVDHRAVRLLYFHPPGILDYQRVVQQWLQKTRQLRNEGRFRWYTMSDSANFLNSRKRVDWNVSIHDGRLTLAASHPDSLEHLTWSLSADRYAEPKIMGGAASVVKNHDAWLVVAGKTRSLQIEARMLGSGVASK